MTLLTVSEILKPSIYQGWGVGGYDVVDIALCQGVLDAALEDQAPVIFLIYPASVPVESYINFFTYLKREIERCDVTAAIALDHGTTMHQIEAALNAGFTGVMIDASRYPLEQNIAMTKKVVDLAHQFGASVEAELGHVGEGSDILPPDLMKSMYTRVEDARRFVDETDVDALAVAIGTAHGLYKFAPQLDFERLAKLRSELDIPLVLHGSSGTPVDQLAKAVKLGINKINVYTDIRMRVLSGIRTKVISEHIEQYDIVDLDNIIRKETKNVVQEKNTLFKSVGKAKLFD